MSDVSHVQMLVREAFMAGTLAALEELFHLEARAEASSFAEKASGSRLHASVGGEEREAVVAEIQLLRDPVGALKIVAPVDVARRLAERYLPPGSEITDELLDDCLGELANVVAGQAKTALKGNPYHFMLTTPIVTRHSNAFDVPTSAWSCMVTSEVGAITILVDLP